MISESKKNKRLAAGAERRGFHARSEKFKR